MRGLGLVGLVLLITVILEVAVLIGVTHLLGGVLWTLLLVLATSALGSLLLRREGIRAWRRFRDAAQQGRAPGEEVSNGLVGLSGAVLLVIPGFLTDLAGLALLVPPVRRLARSRVQAFAERRVSPALATDLFGPRRVRVRRGAAQDSGPAAPQQPSEPGAAIEG
ncbi:MAG: protein FxsA, partial [Micromonosporaceae bacterium]